MTAPTTPARADDRRVAKYVRRTVYPYSAYYREVLRTAGIDGQFRANRDLGRIPPTDLAAVVDPGALVLRPNLQTIVREGRRSFAARAVLAKVAGGMHQFNHRVVEDQFKPIHWIVGEGVPLGYSAADVQRLARRGEQWLERAGVERHDVVLSLLHPGPSVAHWQLVLGCRRARVSAMHLDPTVDPEWAERLAPSVLVGDSQQLVAILARARDAGHALANVRTVLAVGDPLSGDLRTRLRTLAPGAAVIGAWGPAGVRALWTECREAAERPVASGYHAWDDDVLESTPDGELLWTGIGWRGSAVLRLRTYTTVTVERAVCPACHRSGARIVPLAPVARALPVSEAGNASEWAPALVPDDDLVAAAPAAVASPSPVASPVSVASPVVMPAAEAILDAEAEVAAWQVEYRKVGGVVETLVVLAPGWGVAVVPLLRRLDRHLRATQFIVLSADEVASRVEAMGGRRVVGDSAP